MAYDDNSFIIEFHQVGNSVKVTAIDPVTLTEVSIVGSPTATQKQLSDLAAKKLLYVLNKDKS